MKSINCAIVSLFGLLLILNMESAAAEFSGENRKNRGHDTLIKMDVDARNRKLADTVEKTGKVCPKGMKTRCNSCGIHILASIYDNMSS